MQRTKVDTSDLVNAFKRVYNQLSTPVDKDVEKSRRKKPKVDSFAKYKEKMLDLQSNIDTFNAIDLRYYFIDVAERNEVEYISSSLKRDLGAFKILLTKVPAREICLMIEFLFESGQKYLDVNEVTPSILGSAWLNTIRSDSKHWVRGSFDPNKRLPKASREWGKDTDAENIEIGGWGNE